MTDKVYQKAILKPKLLKGLEEAFTLVEKMNGERYLTLEERKRTQRRHSYVQDTEVCAVVISSTEVWKNLLCFCGDEVEEQQIYGNTIEVKKRYVWPVTFISQYVNHATFHPDYVPELEKIYHFRFEPQPVSGDIASQMRNERSDEEILGFALYDILSKGRGFIPREWSNIAWENAKGDKPYQILCEKAQQWMKDNKFDPYP